MHRRRDWYAFATAYARSAVFVSTSLAAAALAAPSVVAAQEAVTRKGSPPLAPPSAVYRTGSSPARVAAPAGEAPPAGVYRESKRLRPARFEKWFALKRPIYPPLLVGDTFQETAAPVVDAAPSAVLHWADIPAPTGAPAAIVNLAP